MAPAAHNSINKKGRRLALRVLTLQFLAAVVLVVLFGFFQNANAAFSATAGAVTSLVPNIVFAVRVFRFGGARSAQHVVNGFYAGEVSKMMLGIVLFILAFTLLDGPWLPFFVVYAVVTFMHWLAPVLLFKN